MDDDSRSDHDRQLSFLPWVHDGDRQFGRSSFIVLGTPSEMATNWVEFACLYPDEPTFRTYAPVVEYVADAAGWSDDEIVGVNCARRIRMRRAIGDIVLPAGADERHRKALLRDSRLDPEALFRVAESIARAAHLPVGGYTRGRARGKDEVRALFWALEIAPPSLVLERLRAAAGLDDA